jgi:hypothetical protein
MTDPLETATRIVDDVLASKRLFADSNLEELRRDLSRRRDALLRTIHQHAEAALISSAARTRQDEMRAEANQIETTLAAIRTAVFEKCAARGKIP